MDDEQLTLLLDGKEYALSESLKQAIEGRAARAFEENWLFDCHWEANERGDPILCIETSGEWVPVDRLEQLEFEMEEVEPEQEQQQDSDDSDEKEDIDSGNGMKSVPRDEVDMNPGEGPTNQPEDEEPPDTGFMVTHPSQQYVPQPEQDDPEKVPPHPDELPEDPTYVQWIPADDSITEHWETGRALVPLSLDVTWNLQLRADEAPEGAMKEVFPDFDSGETEIQMVPKTNRHDEWKEMMERHECEVVAEKKPSDTPPKNEDASSDDEGYSGREADEGLPGKYGGNNWNV